MPDLEQRYHAVSDAGRPAAVASQHKRGKLTARERIELLVDSGTFREFGALALPEAKDGAPGDLFADAVVTGTASVAGRPIVLASFDFTVAGGSNGDLGNSKVMRCLELALTHGHPLALLLEGGGHRIQEGLDSRAFAPGVQVPGLLVKLSGWVPTVAAVLGPGFAGPTLLASHCDFVVMVRGISTMGIAPPSMAKASHGEEISSQDLGGASVQTARNGLADLAVDDEPAAMESLRSYLSYLPGNAGEDPPLTPPVAPAADAAAALDTVVPEQSRRSYDIRDAIAGIVDEGSSFEIKPEYARNMVTSFARIGGRPVGVVANQPLFKAGALDAGACEKAARFVSLCDAFGIALLFLIDLPGFMVGREAESTQLARRGAKLIGEIGRATVPRFSIIVRKAYGAGYIAMAGGRSFGSELVLAWPTAEFAAMAVPGAVDTAFRAEVASAPDPAKARAELIAGFQRQLNPYRAAEGFGIDAVVRPSDTRALLLSALQGTPVRRLVGLNPPRIHPVPPI